MNAVEAEAIILQQDNFNLLEQDYFNELNNYFCHNNDVIQNNITKMISIINGNSMISLRLLDWFVTRYTSLYQYSNILNQMQESYETNLNLYRKTYFDAFRRKARYHYNLNNTMIDTSIGQLNFFKWCFENNVIGYIEDNYETIYNKWKDEMR